MNRYKLSFFIFFISLSFIIKAQVPIGPSIAWQRCYGGSLCDYFTDAITTSDGGFAVTAAFISTDGIMEGQDSLFHPATLMKFDSELSIQWIKNYGGTTGGVGFLNILEIPNNNLIVGGVTETIDGDFEENYGQLDILLMSVDPSGGIIWDKNFGNPDDDILHSILPTEDRGYLLLGESYGSGNDIPTHYGAGFSSDATILKTDSLGALQWVRVIGGSSFDRPVGNPVEIKKGIYQTHIISTSSDYDFADSGVDDLVKRMIVEIDSNGNIINQNIISAEDDFLDYSKANFAYADGTISVGEGNSSSSFYPTVSEHGEDQEGAIAFFDSTLNIKWMKQWGGSNGEGLVNYTKDAVGNYYFFGLSSSMDYDLPGNYNGGEASDYWLLATDSNFNLLWSRNFGGSYNNGDLGGGDFVGTVLIKDNMLYVFTKCIVPETIPDFDIQCGNTPPNYLYPFVDAWLVAFDLTTAILDEYITNTDYIIYPNPTNDILYVEINQTIQEEITAISIFDIEGKKVYQKNLHQPENIFWINTTNFSKGIYLIELIGGEKIIGSEKFVVE